MRKILLALLLFTGLASAYSQVSMDDAIQAAVKTIADNVKPNTKLAVINIESPSEVLSEYIIDELDAVLVNSKKFTVIDRKNLDLIRQEMDFQLSGDVSDESMQSIGKILGAQSIISGTFSDTGIGYRLRIRTINVTSAVIESLSTANVKYAEDINFMLSAAKTAAASSAAPKHRQPTQKTGATYKIGDWGPAGGVVFYDKGSVSNGWRYLEAAPAETETVAPLLTYRSGIDYGKYEAFRGKTDVGSGNTNMQNLIEVLETWNLPEGPALKYAVKLDYDGFNDWFIPSIGELELMYKNLFQRGFGEFSDSKKGTLYLSSSMINNYSPMWYYFTPDNGDAMQMQGNSFAQVNIRLIRAFK
jgi:TolB-like protein